MSSSSEPMTMKSVRTMMMLPISKRITTIKCEIAFQSVVSALTNGVGLARGVCCLPLDLKSGEDFLLACGFS